jgi:hypothetical protein
VKQAQTMQQARFAPYEPLPGDHHGAKRWCRTKSQIKTFLENEAAWPRVDYSSWTTLFFLVFFLSDAMDAGIA